ncbi:MAG: preprotein translocase subunit SecG [Chloroflexi bacterium]|nr:preprotein translocase subunit SecG [Chloroflexota bacterium]
MNLLIGFLTFILVVNSLFLMFLVLIQLPKKEAGAGIAFGGAATDALFGAGKGNALTQMTKYSATLFIGLALVLSVLNSQRAERSARGVEQELLKKQSAPSAIALPPTPATNQLLNKPLLEATPPVPVTKVPPSTPTTNLLSTPPAAAPAVAPPAATATNLPAAPTK